METVSEGSVEYECQHEYRDAEYEYETDRTPENLTNEPFHSSPRLVFLN
jgi:hypothetical protein